MNIAFIGQKGIDLGERGGGIEQHVAALARKLSERGHNVTVYARRKYTKKRSSGIRNVRLRFLPTLYRKNFEAIIHTVLCTIDVMFRDYDIIHYHGVGPATLSFIPRLLKRRTRVIATFHSQDRFHKKWAAPARHYLHFGEWAACWFPHATIAVSHVIQVYARNVFRRKITYIPNGAEVQDVLETNKIEKLGLTAGKYLLNVSRLVPHKGQHYLIQAFCQAQAFGSMKDMKLVLVGAPSFTADYEEKLKALAAGNENVIFLGYQTGEALRQLFAHAYLYVQPSEAEGLAVVVLEAMSFGTPVLVSDIPENIEAMHRSGFSFQNMNVKDLRKELVQLANHPEVVKDAAKSVQYVVNRDFNWNIIAEQTEEVYRCARH